MNTYKEPNLIPPMKADSIVANRYGELKHRFPDTMLSGVPVYSYLVNDKGKLTYMIVDRCIEPEDFFQHDEADVRALFEHDIMEIIDQLDPQKLHVAVMQFKGTGSKVLMRIWHLVD